MSARYEDVLGPLRDAYDRGAAEREAAGGQKSNWKLAERDAFLARLVSDGARSLLEIGAGTGQDSAFFRDHGLNVVATDLSPEMVAICREKGLDARVMDFLHLDFPPSSFDAVYALNCLLHVPNADLPAVIQAIRGVMRPGALFFLGVYGGDEFEGIMDRDEHDPPRFFSRRTDEDIQRRVRPFFEIVDFHTVALERPGFHFQSLTLRRPS